tara:strand:+ start:152 stop:388 length:237 start_codon:yes stop_codon:yes gene_type:complete
MNYDKKIVGEIKKTLAGNIKKYREKLNLTQDQAAEKADITVKYWQRLEMTSQQDLPSLPMLFKIAKSLEVSPSELIKA